MFILEQLKNGDMYTPACEIFSSGSTAALPMVMVELCLPRTPTETDIDQLRIALKDWAKTCGFGVLAERAD